MAGLVADGVDVVDVGGDGVDVGDGVVDDGVVFRSESTVIESLSLLRSNKLYRNDVDGTGVMWVSDGVMNAVLCGQLLVMVGARNSANQRLLVGIGVGRMVWGEVEVEVDVGCGVVAGLDCDCCCCPSVA